MLLFTMSISSLVPALAKEAHAHIVFRITPILQTNKSARSCYLSYGSAHTMTPYMLNKEFVMSAFPKLFLWMY